MQMRANAGVTPATVEMAILEVTALFKSPRAIVDRCATVLLRDLFWRRSLPGCVLLLPRLQGAPASLVRDNCCDDASSLTLADLSRYTHFHAFCLGAPYDFLSEVAER